MLPSWMLSKTAVTVRTSVLHTSIHCWNQSLDDIHFELLVGDYLTMPIGQGGFKTVGVYLDVFSQHIWVQAFKTAGSSKMTIATLE